MLRLSDPAEMVSDRFVDHRIGERQLDGSEIPSTGWITITVAFPCTCTATATVSITSTATITSTLTA